MKRKLAKLYKQDQGVFDMRLNSLPKEDYNYSRPHDRVIVLPKAQYTRAQAELRFREIMLKQHEVPVAPAFLSSGYWCLRVAKTTQYSITRKKGGRGGR